MRGLTEQVLVVGAGPTGLLLAAELARADVAVRIVDQRAEATKESRALALHARALEMLDGLGLAETFIAHGLPVPAFCLWDGNRRLARIDFGVLESPYPFLLDIPQDETERLLREHLSQLGIEVEQSTEVTDLALGPDGVHVTTRSGPSTATCRAPYVVGCDGAHSTVRQRLGMSFDGDSYPHIWMLADVALDWDRPAGEVHVVFNAAGQATVFMPMRDERWRVILYFAGAGDRGRTPPTLHDVAELLAQRVPAVCRSPIRPGSPASGPIAARRRDTAAVPSSWPATRSIFTAPPEVRG